ncbi:MAG TPA: hypothetical protein VL334_21100, partial [Anaerolineae bacterium]|nr:hypothetical protein [Anaerolineae bacterium]
MQKRFNRLIEPKGSQRHASKGHEDIRPTALPLCSGQPTGTRHSGALCASDDPAGSPSFPCF